MRQFRGPILSEAPSTSPPPALSPAPILGDGLGAAVADLESLATGNVRLEADPRARAIKRGMDVVLASVALLVLSPLLALIALAVLLDSPGPILFRQERIGKYGRSFVMLKFRTMVADRRQRNLGPPAGIPERRRTHKSPNDPRITSIGRFLRRSCLDELPQFWNVLRGTMSLVGPRPELPHIVAQYEPWQHSRHLAAPGITGWWQVNRDGVHLMHQSTELDLFYLEHWSIGLDLRILVRTLGIVLRGVGAF
ncbi:MAG: sugar transferase [Chloroflexi bacterium]|nr:sugar transferase [Chloroflexota bacterium]MBV9599119.1 sugar transferase [Chloroflexota bacterium]